MTAKPGYVVVSGSQGRIGGALARRLLDGGQPVVGIDVVPAAEGDSAFGKTSHYLHTIGDAGAPDVVEQALREGANTFGPLRGAVHSAYPRSADWGQAFEELDVESLRFNLAAQLGGAIMFSRSVVQGMRQGGGGSLVLLSSIQGVRAPRFEHYSGLDMSSPAEYAAIKAGVIGFTRWLAKYLSGEGIRVNSVSPGGIDADQPQVFKDRYREDCLSKGLLEPDDVVGAIKFLLSEESQFVSGQNLIVDDGWSL